MHCTKEDGVDAGTFNVAIAGWGGAGEELLGCMWNIKLLKTKKCGVG